jgi:hypothetical protein
MTSLPRCNATRTIGSDTWVFSRMIGQVHIATRSVGNRRTISAQIATAIDICTTTATSARDAAWLTATVMPIPSSVPKIRPARNDRVSCKYSCETTTAEIAAKGPHAIRASMPVGSPSPPLRSSGERRRPHELSPLDYCPRPRWSRWMTRVRRTARRTDLRRCSWLA